MNEQFLKTSKKIIKNTVCDTAGYMWGLLLSLLLTPYIIHVLGIEKFGIWVIVAVVVNYFSLLDFSGIGGAFVKYIAEYNAQRNYKKLNQIVNLGLTYYFIFWIVIFLLVILFKDVLLDLFKFSPELRSEISFVLVGISLVALIRGSLMVYRSVLLGLQRMDIANLISVAISIPNFIGTVLFLHFGFGLRGLVINSIIIALLTVIAQTIWAYKLLPQIKFNPFSFSRELFHNSFIYGIKIQAARFSELINTQIDKILLGCFLNVGVVGFYELGSKIANIANAFPARLLPAVLPASSELDALKDKERLNKLYYRGSKYLACIAFPLTFFVIFNASLIMLLWMGESGYEKSVLAIQILSVGYTATLLVSLGRLIARGIGIPQYEMRSSLLIAVLNVVLSTVLIIKIGFVGALIGTSLSAIIGSIYFIFLFHGHIKESFLHLARNIYLHPLSACITGGFGLWGLNHLFLRLNFLSLPATRIESFSVLIVRGVTFWGIYLFFLFKSGYIDRYDREVFSETVQIIKNLIFRR